MGLRPTIAALTYGPTPALLSASLAGWLLVAATAAWPGAAALCGGGAAWVGPGWAGLRLALALDPPGAMATAWGVMFVAMMPPLVARPVAALWAQRPPRRRLASLALFAGAYAGAWLAVGVVLMAGALALAAFAHAAGVPPLLIAAAIALAWQASPAKRTALRRCRRPPPAGGLGAWRHGLEIARGCIGACWALMLVPLVAAGSLERPLMAAVALALLVERLAAGAPRPTPPAALGARPR
jgi:predicted metal-binding membrane protein